MKETSERDTKLILASASPRRSELLQSIGLSFEVEPSLVDERPYQDESPANYTIRLARAKAMDVSRKFNTGLVLGADTVVVVDSKLLGKPESDIEALEMLRLLSGRWHAVITGIALLDIETGKEATDFDKTLVRFAPLSEDEMEWYVSTGEPLDKAGAYAVQGCGAIFISEINGNYHNVVGLPLSLMYRLARQLGYSMIG